MSEFIIQDKSAKDTSFPITGDLRAQFVAWLLEQGVEVDETKIMDQGAVNRAKWVGSHKNKKDVWFQCWFDQSRPYGRFGDWKTSGKDVLGQWNAENSEGRKLTKAQIEQIKEETRIRKEEYDREQKIKWDQAALECQEIWNKAQKTDTHPYLQKKGVMSHGLRVHKDGRLLIPLYNMEFKIQSLQYIDDNNRKLMHKGGKASGGFFIIGKELIKQSHTLNYVEGYATGASFYNDYREPVIVCFSAEGLKVVSGQIFERQQEKLHRFIADNDESNTGKEKAEQAAGLLKQKNGNVEIKMPSEVGDYNDMVTAPDQEFLAKDMENVPVPTLPDWQKTDKGTYLNVKQNLVGVLLENNIDVAYNVIKKRMEIKIPDADFISDLEEGSAIAEIEDRCIQKGVPHNRVVFNIPLVAREFNPVKEWIMSKPWDGKSRLQMLLDTVQAEDDRLKNILMKRWLLGCVAAACSHKGVSLEGILVFQGKQGLGKTQWLKSLAPRDSDWLLEGATLNPASKDSVKQCVSYWICELGELGSTFKKADIDQLKQFTTKDSDELRLPYDRTWSNYNRRTAFYGSVNEREFLTDTTGNRRFYTVRCTKINYRHSINMQQVWAEIKQTMFDMGESWFLSSEERELLQDSNELSRTQSAVEDLLLQHVTFDSDNTKPVQQTQLLRDLGIANPRMADFKEAARVLTDHGIQPRYTGGKKVYDVDYTPIEKDQYPTSGWSG